MHILNYLSRGYAQGSKPQDAAPPSTGRHQAVLLSRMSGMKEQQFTEEKPLLPEQRGVDSDMRNRLWTRSEARRVFGEPSPEVTSLQRSNHVDKGEEASGGPPRPAPSSQAPPPSRPADRWHVIARHWLRQTRRRASGVLPNHQNNQNHQNHQNNQNHQNHQNHQNPASTLTLTHTRRGLKGESMKEKSFSSSNNIMGRLWEQAGGRLAFLSFFLFGLFLRLRPPCDGKIAKGELKSQRYTESLRSGQGCSEKSPLHGVPLESITVN
ncbi:hypothetical protein EYF80_035678 [Liparis tanakae]|uniref:Uncharacterized protein n=1 Tax=Liparis tanakae TaxID=230148 RepID=A0A4Z2GLA1_9TELE|nr:hypothetical protein EYF80_035678 [Liparis tanakae]